MPRWKRRRWFRLGSWVAALHRVVNAAAVHAPDRAAGVVERALTKRAWWRRRPDIVYLSEVAPVLVRAIASPLGYHTIQYGERGDAAAGVALCLRRKTVDLVGEPELVWASDAVRGEVRARPIIKARVSVRGSVAFPIAATHAPPDRTQRAQDDYHAVYKDVPGFIGGDHNDRPDQMRDAYRRSYRGLGVLGLLIPPRYPASTARAVKGVGDHLGVDVVSRQPRS